MIRIPNRCHWFSRRAFLGGAGVLLALPALEALTAKFARGQVAGAPPQRFLAWYFPCGVPNMDDWRPDTEGMTWALKPMLAELVPGSGLTGLTDIKAKVSVLSDLRNEGQGPDHTYGTGAFLTGYKFEDGKMPGPSFDQVVADAWFMQEDRAPIRSMQLGAPDDVCESQGICQFLNNVSYDTAGNVVTKTMDAGVAFDSMFSGFDGDATREGVAERIARRTSLLDAVHDDAAQLKGVLSATDQIRLDEYMTQVRAVEMQIRDLVTQPGRCAMPAQPITNPALGEEDNHNGTCTPEGCAIDKAIDAHIEVMALAFECDFTRVITFMAAAGATGKMHLPINQDYHLGITHGGPEEQFRQVVNWEVSKFAKLMARLDSKMDFDNQSTILDNMVAFCSSEISNGNGHNHDDMPVLLAGGLGGKLQPGKHVSLADSSFADLYMYLGQQLGVPLGASFGADGQGRITAI